MRPHLTNFTPVQMMPEDSSPSGDSKDAHSVNHEEKKEGTTQEQPTSQSGANDTGNVQRSYQIMNLKSARTADNITKQEEDLEMVTAAWFH